MKRFFIITLLFLCNAVKNMIISDPNFKLIIAGDGEDKDKILIYHQ